MLLIFYLLQERTGDCYPLQKVICPIKTDIKWLPLIVSILFSRKNPFKLLVALDDAGSADGEFFWDDGVSIGIHLI